VVSIRERVEDEARWSVSTVVGVAQGVDVVAHDAMQLGALGAVRWCRRVAGQFSVVAAANTLPGCAPGVARAASANCVARLPPKRRIDTWNGCSEPSGLSAIASPSRIARESRSARTAATISGALAVTSWSDRL